MNFLLIFNIEKFKIIILRIFTMHIFFDLVRLIWKWKIITVFNFMLIFDAHICFCLVLYIIALSFTILIIRIWTNFSSWSIWRLVIWKWWAECIFKYFSWTPFCILWKSFNIFWALPKFVPSIFLYLWCCSFYINTLPCYISIYLI